MKSVKIVIPSEMVVPRDLVGERMKAVKPIIDNMAKDCAKQINELNKSVKKVENLGPR